MPVTKNVDVERLTNSLMRFGAVATKSALFWGDQKAKSIVYANTRYAKGRFRESSSAEVISDYSNKTVTGILTFNPINPASKQKTSYAKALNTGHNLVAWGKPTDYWVKGKFFSEPALEVTRVELKKNFESVKR